MDVLHKLLNVADHNRWLVVGLVAAVLVAAALIGCEPRTVSLRTPGERVTAAELEREAVAAAAELEARQAELAAAVEAHNAAVAAAEDDLSRQIELRRGIVEAVGAVGAAAAGGTLTPAAGVAAMVQVLTLGAAAGAVADNRRKDRVIRDKAATGPPAADT